MNDVVVEGHDAPPADLSALRALVEALDRLEGVASSTAELMRFAVIQDTLSALPAARAALGQMDLVFQERDRLHHWVQALERGMYVNCVHCGDA